MISSELRQLFEDIRTDSNQLRDMAYTISGAIGIMGKGEGAYLIFNPQEGYLNLRAIHEHIGKNLKKMEEGLKESGELGNEWCDDW